ncbi:MAG: hypothetical protein AB8V46_00375 [Candidatus Midichloria sp.]
MLLLAAAIKSYVIFGQTTLLPTFGLSILNGIKGFTITDGSDHSRHKRGLSCRIMYCCFWRFRYSDSRQNIIAASYADPDNKHYL